MLLFGKHLKDQGFYLDKRSFLDALLTSYHPLVCVWISFHNQSCVRAYMRGDFIAIRHNDIRDLHCKPSYTSMPCRKVEPMLQPLIGESFAKKSTLN